MEELNFFLNGQSYGSIADKLLANNMDPGILRPFVGEDGKNYVLRVVGHKADGTPVHKPYVYNAPALLPAQSWQALDTAVIRAARTRLRIWDDLARANTYTIPDGFGTTVLQTQKASDFGSATISMNPIRVGERDKPLMDVDYLPLPITHADFTFDARDLAVSRRAGWPLDTSGAEAAGRRIAEKIEAFVVGSLASYKYANGVVYGYLNFPSRLTYVMVAPTTAGWAPEDTVADFLAIKKLLRTKKRFGPWVVYTSPDWDEILDNDYSNAFNGGTLRDRLRRVEGVGELRSVDSLTGYRMIWVEMVPEVARAVVFMRMQTIRWEEQGGMSQHYKAMCGYVPQLRVDYDGNTGIVDVTAA